MIKTHCLSIPYREFEARRLRVDLRVKRAQNAAPRRFNGSPKRRGGSFGLGEVPMQMTESGERRDGTVKLRNTVTRTV